VIWYIGRRLFWMIPSLIAVSIIAFIIMQLPPGDFVTSYAAELSAAGTTPDPLALEDLRRRWGLSDPIYIQYLRWIFNIVQGDFGISLEWRTPVSQLIWARLGLTAIVAFSTLALIWAVAFPIGIYSAVNQYSVGDYVFTLFGFIGMAFPNFLLALVVMYVASFHLGYSVGGLFSPEFSNAAWSLDRFLDLLSRLWLPVSVLGVLGTASLIRILRANLLDELNKPYTETARAKGLRESTLILRYPVRLALNPFVSTVGWVLPSLISGDVVVSSVMNLETAGPLLLQALKSQDIYLAGAFIVLMCVLVLIGTLLSDVLLALLDPRIRFS
jgi:peptide/nickel transport system permease protein